MEDPVVPLEMERNLYGHPLAGLLWERQFEEVLLKLGWENIPKWKCLFVHRKQGLLLSVKVDDIQMWKTLKKDVDLDEPASFFEHVYLGCTQRECKSDEIMIEEDTKMFESRISTGATEKLFGWEEPHAKAIAWSYDMEGHAQQCVERYCDLANKRNGQLHKVSSPAWMITNSRKRNLNQWENCQKYARKLC